MDKKGECPKKRPGSDTLTMLVAAIFYLFTGVLITIGGCRWVVTIVYEYLNISYAVYAFMLLAIFLLSEITALFIQIPSIKGYEEKVPLGLDTLRVTVGVFFLVGLTAVTLMFFRDNQGTGFRSTLVKCLYKISGVSDRTYEQRLKILEEIIDREDASAEEYVERGQIYLEIGRLKLGHEGEQILSDISPEACFQNALYNFRDAIDIYESISQNDIENYKEVLADCYYKTGCAYYEGIPSQCNEAKEYFEKSIELNKDQEDYYFSAAKAMVGLGVYENDGSYAKALSYVDKAIRLHIASLNKMEDTDIPEQTDGSYGYIWDSETYLNVDDKKLASYYYDAGLISR